MFHSKRMQKLLSQSHSPGNSVTPAPLLAGVTADAKIEISVLPVKYFAPQILLFLLLERNHFLCHLLSFFFPHLARVSRSKGFSQRSTIDWIECSMKHSILILFLGMGNLLWSCLLGYFLCLCVVLPAFDHLTACFMCCFNFSGPCFLCSHILPFGNVYPYSCFYSLSLRKQVWLWICIYLKRPGVLASG